MKKIISILLVGLMVVSLSLASVESAFAVETTTITADDSAPVTVNVGDVVEYTYCLNASQNKIINGEARTLYTGECLEIIDEYAYDSVNEEYAHEPYMFPLYYSKNVIYNTGYNGQILYNFTTAKGACYFNSDDCIFIRVKFRVIGAGDAEIDTAIKYMQDTTGEKIFNNFVPSSSAVKTIGHVATGKTILIGDANSDKVFNITDATQIQLYVAKKTTQVDPNFDTDSADADRNKLVNIADATQIQLKLAKKPVPAEFRLGEWDVIFS